MGVTACLTARFTWLSTCLEAPSSAARASGLPRPLSVEFIASSSGDLLHAIHVGGGSGLGQ
jgi:hypothetical protein